MSETEKLAEFTGSVSFEDIPDDIVEKSKVAIRDFVGVAIHGSSKNIGEIISKYVNSDLSGDASVVLGGQTASPSGAALANGTFGHAIDYDDTFESISIHPTSPIFSAAFAAGQIENASGRRTLSGYIVGSEVAFAIEHGLTSAHYQNGWHSTGTTGSFGAAAAAASVLNLQREEVQRAFGIVASCSSANRKNFGSMVKPLHAGHAAQMGLRAALLARAGFTADEQIFEGELGYGSVMVPGDAYDPEALVETLEDGNWAVHDIAFKPFPSGALTHAPMEVMLRIVEKENLSPDDVESIVVGLDKTTEGVLHHYKPETGLQAKFSMEFCLALILCKRRGTIYDFTDEGVKDEQILGQLSKIQREYEEDLFEGEYDRRGVKLEVILKDGRVIEGEERYTPGGPTNPVSEERLREKYYRCVESVYSEEVAEDLEGEINELDGKNCAIRDFADAIRI